jgi:hypothetical protein
VAIMAAQSASSSPLNALIWIFGVAGGASIVLILTSAALAWNHMKRRNSLREVTLDPKGNASISYPLLERYSRIITSGDLVMDEELYSEAVRLAQEERSTVRNATANRPTSSGGPERA